jgi:hypothetical protein
MARAPDAGDDARTVLPEGTAVPGRVPAEIFAAAVDAFVDGQRLDMRSLARRLGVARAACSTSRCGPRPTSAGRTG